MLRELVENLTPQQRDALAARGIGRQLLWKWKEEARLPTEVQVADVAAVTGADWAELQKEITVLRAPEERREDIARALNWRRRSHPNRRAARVSGLFYGQRREAAGDGRRVRPVNAEDRPLHAGQVATIRAGKVRHGLALLPA